MAVTSKNKEKLLRHVTFVDFRGVYIAFRAGMCSKKAASNQKLYSMIRWSLMINVRAPLWLRQAATALPLCHQSSKGSNASVLTNIFGSIMFYHVLSCSMILMFLQLINVSSQFDAWYHPEVVTNWRDMFLISHQTHEALNQTACGARDSRTIWISTG
jgi:hypothetical protein